MPERLMRGALNFDNDAHRGIHRWTQWCATSPKCEEVKVDLNGIETPPPVKQNIRLRLATCPGDYFLIIIDRAEDLNVGNPEDWSKQVGEAFNERMPNCGGVVIFRQEVDLD